MTSCVTLSRARPRKPFRSPGRIHCGLDLAGPGVGYSLSRDELSGQLLDVLGEASAPGEAATVVGDLTKVELDEGSEALAESQSRAVRLPSMVVVLEDDLDARVDPLGVGGEEVSEPARHFVIRAARKHAGILASASRGDRDRERATGEPEHRSPRRDQTVGRVSTR